MSCGSRILLSDLHLILLLFFVLKIENLALQNIKGTLSSNKQHVYIKMLTACIWNKYVNFFTMYPQVSKKVFARYRISSKGGNYFWKKLKAHEAQLNVWSTRSLGNQESVNLPLPPPSSFSGFMVSHFPHINCIVLFVEPLLLQDA